VLSRFGEDTWPEDANGEPSQSGEDGLDDMEGTPEVPRLGSFEVMNRTIDIAQSALARHTLAAYPPDLLIEVPRSTCRGLEFHRAVEVIAAGRALANRALDALEAEPDRSAPPPIEG